MKKNVVFLGSGIGKAHLAISLAVAVAEGRRRIYFGTLTDLLDSLKDAHAARPLKQRLRTLTHPALLVMTATYGLIGRQIAELEQEGRSRAEYGKETIERLAVDLSARYGRGFSVRNVWLMRAFCLAWPIVQTVSAESLLDAIRPRFPLPWSAYVRLLSVRFAVAGPSAKDPFVLEFLDLKDE